LPRPIADEYHFKCRIPRQFASFNIIPGYCGVQSGIFEDVLQTREYIGIVIQNENLAGTLAHAKLL